MLMGFESLDHSLVSFPPRGSSGATSCWPGVPAVHPAPPSPGPSFSCVHLCPIKLDKKIAPPALISEYRLLFLFWIFSGCCQAMYTDYYNI